MKKVAFAALAIIALLFVPHPAIAAATFTTTTTFTTFEVPPAGSEGFQVTSVSNHGNVAGFYRDVNDELNGFLHQPNGNFASISVYGAAFTYAWGVNDSGSVIGGGEMSTTYTNFGYLRTSDGAFTMLTPPWAYPKYGSFASAINDAGTIAGIYFDQNDQSHGYVRDSAGNYTSFDPPNNYQLISLFINPSGQIAGWYTAQPGGAQYEQVFLRDVDGAITTFTVPGYFYPQPLALGQDGSIAGLVQDSSGTQHVFFCDSLGAITVFDAPNSIANYDSVVGISGNGNVIGRFLDPVKIYGGWQRSPTGAFTTFRDPDAGTHRYQGTVPESASSNGTTAGLYYDFSGVVHGFVMQ